MENKEKKEKEEIVLIAGKMNKENAVRYWKADIKNINIGDYAIVENLNGYDLIKIVGILTTTKQNASLLSNTKYENMKEGKMLVRKYLLEGFGNE